MEKERFQPYQDRVATVIGGQGALGSRVAQKLEPLGFQSVQICEKGDPFLEFVNRSTDLFFAVNNTEVTDMLQAARDHLQPHHTILDGCSVKSPPLITTYKELDNLQISVASTHIGAKPTHSWKGIKVWVCEVGPNSERAKRLAFDLFISTNSSIQTSPIEKHINVEIDQWFSMVNNHTLAGALRNMGFTLEEFDLFSTLNSEITGLTVARTLGQGAKIPSEIIFNQSRKEEFFGFIKQSVQELEEAANAKDTLERGLQENIDFHNQNGAVDRLSDKAGKVGSMLADLRIQQFHLKITDNKAGRIQEVIEQFRIEDANINSVHTKDGIATSEELQRGIDPDKIVELGIGVDPNTIDEEKELRIKERLIELGCIIT